MNIDEHGIGHYLGNSLYLQQWTTAEGTSSRLNWRTTRQSIPTGTGHWQPSFRWEIPFCHFFNMVPKLDKITCNMTFGHFSNISTSWKLEMNIFSGSTNLRRLLGEYEPFNALYCYCKGLLSLSYGPKIGQNYMKYDFWALFKHFPNVIFHAILTNFWTIWPTQKPLTLPKKYVKGLIIQNLRVGRNDFS